MISRLTVAAIAVAAILGAAALPAAGQQPPTAPAQAQPQRPYASQLMTPEERDAYRRQMQEAKTPDERAKLRDAHRAEMQKRAREQGLTLQGPRGQPRMYGADLMTPQERDAYVEQLRAAKTPEERLKLRDDHRADMQKRAQERGVTLPAPRGPGAAAGPAGAPAKGTARRSQIYGDEFFTPDERRAFFDRMKAARTPEERAQIQAEHRATAEARAKEKGVTLPPPPGPVPGAPKAQ